MLQHEISIHANFACDKEIDTTTTIIDNRPSDKNPRLLQIRSAAICRHQHQHRNNLIGIYRNRW